MSKSIKDPILGDYEIQVEGNQFTLVKNGLTAPKEGQEQKETQKTCGYFSTLPGALTEAVKLLTMKKMGDVSTLQEYIATMKSISGEIVSKFQNIQ